MLFKRVLKHKTSFICYFELHDLYLFTFLRLHTITCAGMAHKRIKIKNAQHSKNRCKIFIDIYNGLYIACYDFLTYRRKF